MSEAIRAHGLYYPFFRIRDDGWLKVTPLYWPKIVRLVPASDDLAAYTARPSSNPAVPTHALTRNVAHTMRVLTEELGVVERVPPRMVRLGVRRRPNRCLNTTPHLSRQVRRGASRGGDRGTASRAQRQWNGSKP